MTSQLAAVLGAGLEGVSLSSRGSDKFDQLARLLGEQWHLEPGVIGIKALKDAKNFGNRVAEATRLPIARLVLLAEDDVDLDAVSRALQGKALFRVPTILGIHQTDGWSVVCAFVPVETNSPFGVGVPIRDIPPPAVRVLGASEVSAIRSDVLALANSPAGTDVEAAIRSPGRTGRVLVVKHVTESKNLANRVGEGLARRPDVCVIVVSDDLKVAAMQTVRELSKAVPATAVFLVVESGARLEVSEVRTNNGPSDLGADKVRLGAGARPPLATQVREEVVEYAPDDGAVYRTLERVRQLRRHLPLDANADDLYEETLGSGERLRYETKTLGFLRNLLARPERVVVVLTGNAGHGKTHMCRRLLEGDGAGEDVMARLSADAVGGLDWDVRGSPLPVRVIKDLSEINPPDRAAQRIEALIQQTHAHVIVCANEGRLRDVVERRPTHLRALLAILEQGPERGGTCLPNRPDLHVVNLNYQAATGDDGGFLNHVLDHFLNHESAWKVCGSCAARDQCPILANRHDLAMSPALSEANAVHRDALSELIRIVEESGYVLTYRETLVLVAYLVTAGLTCSGVEQLHRRSNSQELARGRLLELLFEPSLSDDEADVLRILQRIGRLDPGHVAIRSVDERLHRELEDHDQLGHGLFDESSRQLSTRHELRAEEEGHRLRLRSARRMAWLNSLDGRDQISRSERLGLRHHDLFRALSGEPDVRDVISTIRAVVKGIHTIQGAVGVDSVTTLHLVDPAFGRSGSHSAIIARSIRIRDLELDTESGWWRRLAGDGTPDILDSVEWIDRRLVLVERPTQRVVLRLDLMVFEFVVSAGQGIVMRDFHSAERRRILRRLARLAEESRDSTDDIRVLLERGEGTLTVERDGTILLERNA